MHQLFLVIGAIGAALFGALALLTNFRNKTNTGRIATTTVIIGLVAATALSLIGNHIASLKVTRQETQRHIGLLGQIWKEGTRIHSGNIFVIVEYEFLTESMSKPPDPPIMGKGWEMSLAILPNANSRVSKARWKWRKPKQTFLLTPNRQETTWFSSNTVDTIHYTQRSLFSFFAGNLGDNYGFPDRWHGVVLDLHLSGRGDEGRRILDMVLGESSSLDDGNDREKRRTTDEQRLRDQGARQFEELYGVKPEEAIPYDDFSITPTPCRATATLYLAGRPVATTKAQVVSVRIHDEDVQGKTIADFQLVSVGTVFPAFDLTAVSTKKTTVWTGMGSVIIVVIIGAVLFWYLSNRVIKKSV